MEKLIGKLSEADGQGSGELMAGIAKLYRFSELNFFRCFEIGLEKNQVLKKKKVFKRNE